MQALSGENDFRYRCVTCILLVRLQYCRRIFYIHKGGSVSCLVGNRGSEAKLILKSNIPENELEAFVKCFLPDILVKKAEKNLDSEKKLK